VALQQETGPFLDLAWELQEFSGVTARNAHCAAMARLPLLMTCLPDDRARKQSG